VNVPLSGPCSAAALSVASIPAAGGAADAGHGNQETKAILKAIL